MAMDATPWRDHIKLVVQTPEGLRSFEPMQLLLETLTNISVETVADFSTRLPPGYLPAAEWAPQASSKRGGFGDLAAPSSGVCGSGAAGWLPGMCNGKGVGCRLLGLH